MLACKLCQVFNLYGNWNFMASTNKAGCSLDTNDEEANVQRSFERSPKAAKLRK